MPPSGSSSRPRNEVDVPLAHGPGKAECGGMKTAVSILLALAMVATLGVLFAGMFGLARGQSGERSNRLMRWRVGLQGLALALFVLLVLLNRG